MNGFSIFLFLLIILITGIFIIGVIILLLGLLKSDKKNAISKTGLILIGIPLSMVAIAFLVEFVHNTFAEKPNDTDLIGIWHIIKASGQIPKSSYNSYKLEFKKDGTFYLSPTPNVNVCENGEYSVNWQFNLNEISFKCEKGFTTAHIDRGFSSVRIEFIIGDPDSGKSIYFARDD